MFDASKLLGDLMTLNSRSVELKRSTMVGRAPNMAADEFLVHHPEAEQLDDRYRIGQRSPLPRRYKATSLGGFCETVHAVCKLYDVEEDPVVVFVCESGVTAVLGERTRREQVVMSFDKSDGYTALADGDTEGMEHIPFVDMLRLDFKNAVMPPDFVPSVKKLKFSQNANGHSEVAVGRESMGRAVLTKALADGQAIAEEVVLSVQVFENVNEDVVPLQGVRCGVRMNLRESKLGLTPLAGEMHSLLHKALDSVAAWLRTNLPEGMAVLNGADAALD